MEQGSIDDDLATLEESYTKYMTEKDPTKILDHPYSELLELLEAYEAETLQLMRDIDVTDGFCSTCHTMLDNWPDLEPWMEGQAPMADGDTGPRISPYSSSTVLYPGAWIQHGNQVKYVLPYQGQIARLGSAARKGCRFCALALQTVKDEDWLVLYRLIEWRLCRLGKPSRMSVVVHTSSGYARTGRFDIIELGFPGRLFHYDHVVNFYPPSLYLFRNGNHSNDEGSQPFRDTSLQASASQSLLVQLAQRWTTNCLQFHSHCNLERPRCYPSRLLCIAVDPIRLVITAPWTDRPLYATLSHCWGVARFETLETTNFDELQRGVPDRLLSKTFLHAVQITRAVGLAYLWIDSLCIIQDSNEDWEAEASMMASVYGGSSLNIAASSARDGSEGCFLKPLDHAGGFTARVCTNGETEVVEFCTQDVYSKNVDASHLATRAWTVQEKVLPPRTLHCSDQGFFWECRTQIASQYFPHGFSNTNRYVHCRSVRWNDKNLMAYWRTLKEWYSRCDLTNPGDKLVALSGVARAIQNKTGDQYFAGLWRKTLERELCWTPQDRRQRPQYRAPSWSWAAVDGRVFFNAEASTDLFISHAHVRSVSTIPVHPGGDTLGAVLHGTLSLHCDMIVCGTVIAEDIARANRRSCLRWHNRVQDQERGACFSRFGQTDHVLPFLLHYAEQKDSRVGQIIFYLPLCSMKHPNGLGEDQLSADEVFGLVVEKTNTAHDQYRRIGPFHYLSCRWWNNHGGDSGCVVTKDYLKFIELTTRVSSSGFGGLTINIV